MAKFNIEAHLHRLIGRSKDKREVAWIRRYATIDTAVRRCTQFLVTEGQVGDVIEFVLIKIPGYQVGTVSFRIGGKGVGSIEVLWNREEANKIRNDRLLGRD